jgi:mannose-1-phosphate guanylyltransferase
MKGFILAAGYGERLRPLTNSIPKPLIQICNKPAILYSVALLKEAGIRDVICNLHYLPEQIKKYFSDNKNFGLNIEFSYEPEILGTGGALYKCRSLLADEPFMLVNSDVICDINLSSFAECSAPVIAVTGRGQGRTVSVRDNKVADFKGVLGSGIPPSYDYMGIAFLDGSIFRHLVPEHSSVVYTAYTALAGDQQLRYFHHQGFWGDIGTMENIKSVEEYLKENPVLIKRVEIQTAY